MDQDKREALEAAGLRIGDAGDFLGLSDGEWQLVEGLIAENDRLREVFRRVAGGILDAAGRANREGNPGLAGYLMVILSTLDGAAPPSDPEGRRIMAEIFDLPPKAEGRALGPSDEERQRVEEKVRTNHMAGYEIRGETRPVDIDAIYEKTRRVEALKLVGPAMLAELKRLEWCVSEPSIGSGGGICPACGGIDPENQILAGYDRPGHKPGCTLDAVIRKAEGRAPCPPS